MSVSGLSRSHYGFSQERAGLTARNWAMTDKQEVSFLRHAALARIPGAAKGIWA